MSSSSVQLSISPGNAGTNLLSISVLSVPISSKLAAAVAETAVRDWLMDSTNWEALLLGYPLSASANKLTLVISSYFFSLTVS